MKIGIDYGGIIEFDEYWFSHRFIHLSKRHEIYLVSHAHAGEDHKRRSEFCNKSNAVIDRTFSDIAPNNEPAIEIRKAEIVRDDNIDIFIDDYMNRCLAVQKMNPDCICIYAPPAKLDYLKLILEGL